MDLLATYPRRLVLLLVIAAFLVFVLRAPIAFLNGWRAEQEVEGKQAAWAVSEYRRGLILTPRDASLMMGLAYSYKRLGDAENEGVWYRRSAQADTSYEEPVYFLALWLSKKGDFASAADTAREAIRRDPSLYRDWQLLAISEQKAGRPDAALDAWREIERRFPAFRKQARDHIDALTRR